MDIRVVFTKNVLCHVIVDGLVRLPYFTCFSSCFLCYLILCVEKVSLMCTPSQKQYCMIISIQLRATTANKQWSRGYSSLVWLQISGNVSLARSVNASLYDILCSTREDWPYGLRYVRPLLLCAFAGYSLHHVRYNETSAVHEFAKRSWYFCFLCWSWNLNILLELYALLKLMRCNLMLCFFRFVWRLPFLFSLYHVYRTVVIVLEEYQPTHTTVREKTKEPLFSWLLL